MSLANCWLTITGTIKINLDPNKIIFFINKSVLVSKLIDGNFPDYEKVIPKNNTNILTVDRNYFFYWLWTG